MSKPAIGQIDEIIHGRLRLGVMTYLVQNDVADFNELKSALAATQGNLSVHLRKLEEAGYVTIEKSFLDRKPLTRVRISKSGRRAFARYVEAMAALLGPADDKTDNKDN